MAKKMEVHLRDVIIRFDGDVFEVFDPTEHGSVRFLPQTLEKISLEDEFLILIHKVAQARSMYWVDPDQRSQAGELIDAVNAART